MNKTKLQAEMQKQLEIDKNISNVKKGKPLTLPLATLNKYFEFRKVWENSTKNAVRKGYDKKYRQKPEVKEHIREYRKAYYQRKKRGKIQCNARTKYNRRCNYDAIIGGYCMMHWRAVNNWKHTEKNK